MRVICCDECFHRIATNKSHSAKVWMRLCEMYGQFGTLAIKEYLITEPDSIDLLRDLECSGFINTLDGENLISLRVNGLETMVSGSEIIQTFCISRSYHDEDWG